MNQIKIEKMIKNNLKLIFIILYGLLSACKNETDVKTTSGAKSQSENLIDTLLMINSEEVNLVVNVHDDYSRSYIQRGDYDTSPEDPIEDEDEYWVKISKVFTIQFQDKKNKFGSCEAVLNMDFINKAVSNNAELNNKVSIDEALLDENISFLGLTESGIAMFKVSTYWGNGDGAGQEWTIGMLFNSTEWADDYKGKKIRHTPICIMEVIDNTFDGFHYKNNKYFLGNFIGNWNYDCEFMSGIRISKEEKYISVPIQSNQIYLKARFELEDGKLLLFLNNESGFEFGDFGAGGNSLPWDEYSREKPFATLSKVPKDKNKLKIKWLGFFNMKSNKYESNLPEFMNIVEGKIKSDILNRCD